MRYLTLTLGLAVTTLAVIFATLWRLDPYGYYGRFPKGLYTDGTFRHVKALLVREARPELVVLGASTAVPIDPAALGQCRAFNGAFNGARPQELVYMARDILPDSVHAALVGLDFFAFNKATSMGYDNPDFGRVTWSKTMAYTLSFQALREAKFVSKMARFDRQQVLDRGNGARLDAAIDAENDAKSPKIDHATELAWVRRDIFGDWSYDTAGRNHLEQLRDALAGRGITAAVYVTPMSDSLLALLQEMGITPDLERFRRDVLEVFPDAVDFTSTMSDNRLFMKRDPLHFPQATANQLARDVLTRHGLCGYRRP